MAFQIKDFVSICAGMINHMRGTQTKITDFNVGSVARTLIEAPAVEIDQLYQQMFAGLREAIPVTTYNAFGFEALPAVAASGIVRFSCAAPAPATVLIPAGTEVRTTVGSSGYTTTADVSLLAGTQYIDAMVYYGEAGIQGNANADTVTELTFPLAGVESVTNPLAFTNGQDAETDLARKSRFQGYIAALQHGTVSAVRYGALQAKVLDANGLIIERVKLVHVREPYLTDVSQPVALVLVYIHNGTSGASDSLIAKTQSLIDGFRLADGTPVVGYKAAGAIVNVLAATPVAVNVTATATINTYSDASAVRTAVAEAIRAYLYQIEIGIACSPSEIIATAMKVPGVLKFVLATPTVDVAAAYSQKIIPGTIGIS